MSLEKILVTGATGQQGGTLAKLLLQKNHKVYALVRNVQSPAAQELKRVGDNAQSCSPIWNLCDFFIIITSDLR
jgi:nucleoside-diphosphate-sugar epimerase